LRDSEGRILLLRHSYGAKQWALPGGGLSEKEDAVQGATREMQEELGLELAHLTLLGELDEVISRSPHHAYVFEAIIDDEPRPDNREVIEARFFDAEAIPNDISSLTRRRLNLLGRD